MSTRRRGDIDPGSAGPGGVARNKRGTPVYSREDIREQYCINDKELHVLETSRRKPIFGCLTSKNPQTSPCRKRILLPACLRNRAPSDENFYSKSQSTGTSPSRRQQIDYEDESYFKRRPKSICYTDPKRFASLDDEHVSKGESAKDSNACSPLPYNVDRNRRPTHLSLSSGEYHSTELLQENCQEGLQRHAYTQPNTPDLGNSVRYDQAPDALVDDRPQPKHVSFEKAMSRSATVGAIEDAEVGLSDSPSGHGGNSKSAERLLDTPRSPEYYEQKALDQLLAPVLTKALLQGNALRQSEKPDQVRRKVKIKVRKEKRSVQQSTETEAYFVEQHKRAVGNTEAAVERNVNEPILQQGCLRNDKSEEFFCGDRCAPDTLQERQIVGLQNTTISSREGVTSGRRKSQRNIYVDRDTVVVPACNVEARQGLHINDPFQVQWKFHDQSKQRPFYRNNIEDHANLSEELNVVNCYPQIYCKRQGRVFPNEDLDSSIDWQGDGSSLGWQTDTSSVAWHTDNSSFALSTPRTKSPRSPARYTGESNSLVQDACPVKRHLQLKKKKRLQKVRDNEDEFKSETSSVRTPDEVPVACRDMPSLNTSAACVDRRENLYYSSRTSDRQVTFAKKEDNLEPLPGSLLPIQNSEELNQSRECEEVIRRFEVINDHVSNLYMQKLVPPLDVTKCFTSRSLSPQDKDGEGIKVRDYSKDAVSLSSYTSSMSYRRRRRKRAEVRDLSTQTSFDDNLREETDTPLSRFYDVKMVSSEGGKGKEISPPIYFQKIHIPIMSKASTTEKADKALKLKENRDRSTTKIRTKPKPGTETADVVKQLKTELAQSEEIPQPSSSLGTRKTNKKTKDSGGNVWNSSPGEERRNPSNQEALKGTNLESTSASLTADKKLYGSAPAILFANQEVQHNSVVPVPKSLQTSKVSISSTSRKVKKSLGTQMRHHLNKENSAQSSAPVNYDSLSRMNSLRRSTAVQKVSTAVQTYATGENWFDIVLEAEKANYALSGKGRVVDVSSYAQSNDSLIYANTPAALLMPSEDNLVVQNFKYHVTDRIYQSHPYFCWKCAEEYAKSMPSIMNKSSDICYGKAKTVFYSRKSFSLTDMTSPGDVDVPVNRIAYSSPSDGCKNMSEGDLINVCHSRISFDSSSVDVFTDQGKKNCTDVCRAKIKPDFKEDIGTDKDMYFHETPLPTNSDIRNIPQDADSTVSSECCSIQEEERLGYKDEYSADKSLSYHEEIFNFEVNSTGISANECKDKYNERYEEQHGFDHTEDDLKHTESSYVLDEAEYFTSEESGLDFSSHKKSNEDKYELEYGPPETLKDVSCSPDSSHLDADPLELVHTEDSMNKKNDEVTCFLQYKPLKDQETNISETELQTCALDYSSDDQHYLLDSQYSSSEKLGNDSCLYECSHRDLDSLRSESEYHFQGYNSDQEDSEANCDGQFSSWDNEDNHSDCKHVDPKAVMLTLECQKGNKGQSTEDLETEGINAEYCVPHKANEIFGNEESTISTIPVECKTSVIDVTTKENVKLIREDSEAQESFTTFREMTSSLASGGQILLFTVEDCASADNTPPTETPIDNVKKTQQNVAYNTSDSRNRGFAEYERGESSPQQDRTETNLVFNASLCLRQETTIYSDGNPSDDIHYKDELNTSDLSDDTVCSAVPGDHEVDSTRCKETSVRSSSAEKAHNLQEKTGAVSKLNRQQNIQETEQNGQQEKTLDNYDTNDISCHKLTLDERKRRSQLNAFKENIHEHPSRRKKRTVQPQAKREKSPLVRQNAVDINSFDTGRGVKGNEKRITITSILQKLAVKGKEKNLENRIEAGSDTQTETESSATEAEDVLNPCTPSSDNTDVSVAQASDSNELNTITAEHCDNNARQMCTTCDKETSLNEEPSVVTASQGDDSDSDDDSFNCRHPSFFVTVRESSLIHGTKQTSLQELEIIGNTADNGQTDAKAGVLSEQQVLSGTDKPDEREDKQKHVAKKQEFQEETCMCDPEQKQEADVGEIKNTDAALSCNNSDSEGYLEKKTLDCLCVPEKSSGGAAHHVDLKKWSDYSVSSETEALISRVCEEAQLQKTSRHTGLMTNPVSRESVGSPHSVEEKGNYEEMRYTKINRETLRTPKRCGGWRDFKNNESWRKENKAKRTFNKHQDDFQQGIKGPYSFRGTGLPSSPGSSAHTASWKTCCRGEPGAEIEPKKKNKRRRPRYRKKRGTEECKESMVTFTHSTCPPYVAASDTAHYRQETNIRWGKLNKIKGPNVQVKDNDETGEKCDGGEITAEDTESTISEVHESSADEAGEA